MNSAVPQGSAWKVYRRLLGFARPYRGLLALAALGALIEAAAGSGFVALMKPVTDETFINKNAGIALWLPRAIYG